MAGPVVCWSNECFCPQVGSGVCFFLVCQEEMLRDGRRKELERAWEMGEQNISISRSPTLYWVAPQAPARFSCIHIACCMLKFPTSIFQMLLLASLDSESLWVLLWYFYFQYIFGLEFYAFQCREGLNLTTQEKTKWFFWGSVLLCNRHNLFKPPSKYLLSK